MHRLKNMATYGRALVADKRAPPKRWRQKFAKTPVVRGAVHVLMFTLSAVDRGLARDKDQPALNLPGDARPSEHAETERAKKLMFGRIRRVRSRLSASQARPWRWQSIARYQPARTPHG
jgi:hypothetical protein